MMISKFNRNEYKYFVPYEQLDPLRDRFMMFMDFDPFCAGMEGHQYTVRSIYLDTPRLLFYNEKLDGIKVRKKLRIRVYNELEHNTLAFLEIKRKIENTVFKERCCVTLPETIHVLNGVQIHLPEGSPFVQVAALEKFKYLIKRLNLTPSVLVTYEREALVGIDDPSLRVTFDKEVRSYPNPEIEEIFRENELTNMVKGLFVLEVKFNGRMPVWIRNIIRDFNLHLQSISKYCNGIDSWGARRRSFESLD